MKALIDLGIARVMQATCPRGAQVVWFRNGKAVLTRAGKKLTSEITLLGAWPAR